MSYGQDMSERPTTRTQRRTLEAREAILDAAESILSEGGIAALTTEEVARRTDMAIQTVYNRVGGKQALLIAIAERALEATRAFLDVAYAEGGPPDKQIRRVSLAYARLAFERPHSFRIFANPPEEPEAIKRVAELANEQHAKLANIIQQGIDAGLVRTVLNPEVTATALWAMMNGLLTIALRNDAMRPSMVSPQALVEMALLVLESGLQYLSPETSSPKEGRQLLQG
ncbi:TetR/AcrR family transcriptional regulator [Pseudoduganella danionis]